MNGCNFCVSIKLVSNAINQVSGVGDPTKSKTSTVTNAKCMRPAMSSSLPVQDRNI